MSWLRRLSGASQRCSNFGPQSVGRRAQKHVAGIQGNLRGLAVQTKPREASIDDVRNIGIIAHVDAGKTTTTEAMLYNSGVTRHLGNVDHGDTVTDFLPMERKRGITIQSAAITFRWPSGHRLKSGESPHIINLIDTPGHQDFRFEVERCMPVLDGAVCVIDGVEGVEAHTERVWSSAQEFKVPRIVLVNKLDRDGASFKKSVQDIAMKLNGLPLVCHIPWWEKETVQGIVDVISRSVVSWKESRKDKIDGEVDRVPPFPEEIEQAREKLIETLCEHDDELMELWLEKGKDLAAANIHASIRKLIQDGQASLIPVFAGASLKNIGVASLMDAVNSYLPSPRDRPEIQVKVGSDQRALTEVLKESHDPNVPSKHRTMIEALAAVFKVVNDPKRGMLTFVRVYHGAFKKNTPVWNSNLQNFETPLNIMQISGKDHVEIPQLGAGQIGAITGLKKARTGDTLLTYFANRPPHGPFANVKVRPPEIPPAVAFIVLEPLGTGGAKLIEAALEKLSREDPSLRWSLDEKMEQYTLSGMGKLHLEVARDRLENHYSLQAHWGSIEVGYKECVTAPTAEHHHLLDRVIAGKAGKAGCSAQVEPLEEGQLANLAKSEVERDGNIIRIVFKGDEEIADWKEIKPLLLNGAFAALARGPRRGSPLNNCRVTITFDNAADYFGPTPGSHYASAALHAVKAALKEAHKQGVVGILEPVMRVVLGCPEAAAKTVQHDLYSARGGHVIEVKDLQDASARQSAVIDIQSVYAPPDPYEFQKSLRESRKGSIRMLEIVANVPLVEMLEYDQHLRSMTGGRHTLSMAFDTFELVTGQRESKL